MLPFLLISSLPFTLVLLLTSKPKSRRSWLHDVALLLLLLLRELACVSWRWLASRARRPPRRMPSKARHAVNQEAPVAAAGDRAGGFMILDLPELALERVLEKLSPAALAATACVCASLRDRCRGDHLWERHVREKWSGVTGEAARKEWESYVAGKRNVASGSSRKQRTWMDSLSRIWPLSWIKAKFYAAGDSGEPAAGSPTDSFMSWYLALESGRFSFPAQVYNREDGHVGFVLSCYDAHLSYDRRTDTFCARYPPLGQKPVRMEDGVQWNRIRAPPVNTRSLDLHVSDCLNDLRPGDHFEIQWRRNKEFPYGWWYGVVGHLVSCNANERLCRCHEDDTIELEFKHYAAGSRWRHATINRKKHREKGDEADGFYGGIRKLQTEEEIATWRRFWPVGVLD